MNSSALAVAGMPEQMAPGLDAQPTTEAPSAEHLALWALAFEHKLNHLFDDLDEQWHRRLLQRWPFWPAVARSAHRQVVQRRLFQDLCGGVPALQRLADPWVRLVLLPREALLASLAALALARRPGVLRCCIDRPRRTALEQLLGPHWALLCSLSVGGSPLPDLQATWTPLHWVCQGYFDWVKRLSVQDAVVRRVVRLSLPPEVLGQVDKQRCESAERSVKEAAQCLQSHAGVWPC